MCILNWYDRRIVLLHCSDMHTRSIWFLLSFDQLDGGNSRRNNRPFASSSFCTLMEKVWAYSIAKTILPHATVNKLLIEMTLSGVRFISVHDCIVVQCTLLFGVWSSVFLWFFQQWASIWQIRTSKIHNTVCAMIERICSLYYVLMLLRLTVWF